MAQQPSRTAAPARATTRCASRSGCARWRPIWVSTRRPAIWGLTREDCIDLAAKWEIPITVTKEKLYSIDDNLWGKAIECGAIEDPWAPPPDDVYTLTRVTETEPVEVVVGFEAGVPVVARRRVAVALRRHPAARRGGREPGLRPPRHGGEPPRGDQEP